MGSEDSDLEWKQYSSEDELPLVMDLIDKELSEPYSIFTYRYFINNWPQLCFLVLDQGTCVGTIVCKMDQHRYAFRGYIAMLVVDKPYRKRKLGSKLVCRAIEVMRQEGVEEVMLEAEVDNYGALALYENLGFIRDKRLHKYYLGGQDAFRLKLLPRMEQSSQAEAEASSTVAGAPDVAQESSDGCSTDSAGKGDTSGTSELQ
ncbi:N-alpha-acetyltransferase mak3 [Cymbomonas tetramitiformis]|uniref:N-alpha-acetyltransferase mak3 n=1 Tax=Cymbomonas tetramitiformis TaxID=36881 RepID=A0AAE0EQB1_9CHLO|nr:N-alpha-acetyltransferase mak3 [Cymbomonas tetramitiformis]|eukprot:gene8990-10652_t